MDFSLSCFKNTISSAPWSVQEDAVHFCRGLNEMLGATLAVSLPCCSVSDVSHGAAATSSEQHLWAPGQPLVARLQPQSA